MTVSVENRPRRIVIFTSRHLAASTIEALEAILSAFPGFRLLVVQGDRSLTKRRYWITKIRRLLTEPVSYPLELLGQLLLKARRKGRFPPTGAVRFPQLDELAPGRVEVRAFSQIHDPECLAAVRDFQPWLGVSIGAPILLRKLFSLPERGTINLHKSLLPEYRGGPYGFWELHDGSPQTGASVHWMDDGLDTGPILRQHALAIDPYPSNAGLTVRLDELGIQVLVEAIRDVDQGTERSVTQAPPTTPARKRPRFLTQLRVRRKLAMKRRTSATGAKAVVRNWVKLAALFGFTFVWAPCRNLIRSLRGDCHVAILVYHRVNDGYLDSVSVGVEQFQEQVRLLARHYPILDLATFFAQRGRPRNRPAVIITFDDGYADNYLAARIMRRKNIPATFFISTSYMDSQRAFPHDLQKLKRRVPTLSWNQIRELANWGFTFGNHTVRHADVAQLPLAEALAEIREASAEIVAKVGDVESQKWFAYPYGTQKNMRQEVRDRLETLGIEYCFSAYGGINSPHFDPKNILRQGVDHNYSLLALRAAVEGWPLQEQAPIYR